MGLFGNDDSATQVANYNGIAGWYSGLSDQNLIADGRIIASSEQFTDPPGPRGLGTGGEPEWIQNYAAQLAAAGGGLVLGTDHFDFQDGINTINSLIGIDPFLGIYNQNPFQATVDPSSPLYIGGLEQCTFDTSQSCINNNSSSGFVPTGLQPNGQFLHPVAFHGGVEGFDNAAVSTTHTVPEPSTLLLLGIGFAAVGCRRRRKH